ncbi:MAG: DUF4388 domain-containing protein [Acidimicrobiia bacterium]|nr:DUF4388 domain-containing protein [Acidimicrobiia bacterium]
MSLQGSLDGFPLPDVLALLASTKKRGELRVAGQHGAGRVWMADGAVVGAESGSAHGPVDVLFELLRVDTGSFTFDPKAKVPAGKPHDLEPLLAEAQARLSEWALIEAVVPSLATAVDLADQLPASKVTVTASQWRVLRAVAGGATVADVARLLEADEFHACQAVKRLVDAGLVSVGEGMGTVVDDVDDVDEDDVDIEESDVHDEHDDDEVLEDAEEDEDGTLEDVADDDDGETEEPDPDELVSIPAHLRRSPREKSPEPRKEKPTRPSPMSIAAARRRAELAAARGDGDDLVGAAAAALTPDNANALVQELAALGTDVREASEVIRAASRAPSPAERAAALEGVLANDEGEPVNRALLVKFLSSVRS